jgi:hypothetical protein
MCVGPWSNRHFRPLAETVFGAFHFCCFVSDFWRHVPHPPQPEPIMLILLLYVREWQKISLVVHWCVRTRKALPRCPLMSMKTLPEHLLEFN